MQPHEAEAICQCMVWAGHELVPGGAEVDVTAENFLEFKSKALDPPSSSRLARTST